MPRRKQLKGVANDLAATFISRYNALDGYWAIGKLYNLATEKGVGEVEFDLLEIAASIDEEGCRKIASHHRTVLFRMCAANGLSRDWVRKASILVRFGSAIPDFRVWTSSPFGDPFEVRAEIVDDLGRLRRARVWGRCRHHDPRRELKSLGSG